MKPKITVVGLFFIVVFALLFKVLVDALYNEPLPNVGQSVSLDTSSYPNVMFDAYSSPVVVNTNPFA